METFLYICEEVLQQRTAGGEQQRQPRASISMCRRRRLFMQRDAVIEFSMFRTPQWTMRVVLSGSPVEHADTRLRMSLYSRASSCVTDGVRIGSSCAVLHV